METLKLTLTMYARVLERSSTLMLRNWPVLATVFVYLAILDFTLPIAMALGMLGGFLVSLVRAACAASFLRLVEMIVRTSRVSLDDFRRSFGVYLWDVVGVLFVLWIFQAVAVPALLQSPSGLAIVVSLELVAFVFFNAVPELIYFGHHSALDLFAESARFITANWIEWFPPNLLAAVGFAVLLALPLPGGALGLLLRSALLALFVYFVMVMRGLLFQELYGSSRRSRLFRWRASQ